MKKITAAILALFMLLSLSFAPAMADEEIHSDLQFAKGLGFITSGKGAGEEITRIELAEIFYNIVFPDQNSDNKYWGEGDFPDVPLLKKNIVSAVSAMGIMKGYSESVFAPDDTVTFNQVVKAMVSFLGYDLQAQMLGGYPSGYLAQASRLKILSGENISGDAKATFGAVASMLKRAVGVDIATYSEFTTENAATQNILKGTDYLAYYRDIYLEKGVISGNYLTNMYGGDETGFFSVDINGQNIKVTKSAHGLQDMLGRNVYVYYTLSGSDKAALYFEEGINNVLEINSADLISVSKGEVKYYLGDGNSGASFDTKAPLIYNGSNVPVYTADDLNPFTTGKYDGTIKLIDNTGDGIYDCIVITSYETFVVSDVRENKVYAVHDVSENPYDKVIDLQHYRERNINIRSIIGEPMEPSDIRNGNVINVCYDKSGVIKEMIVTKDTVSGIIEEVCYVGGKISSITISGIYLQAASSLKIYDSAGKFGPGQYVNAYLNCQMQLALLDLEGGYTEGFSVGYLVDAGVEGGLEKTVLCMIFDTEGVMNTFSLYNRILVNGTTLDSETALNQFEKDGNRIKRKLVLYKTDLEGKYITALEIPKHLENTAEAYDGIYQFPEEENILYTSGLRTFNDFYAASDEIIAFKVPENSKRDEYEKYSIMALSTNEDNNQGPFTMQLYGTKKEAFVVDYVAIVSGNASGAVDNTRPFFLVTDVASTIDEYGDSVLKIKGTDAAATGIVNGEFYIKAELFTGERRPFIDQNETLPTPGDVFRVPSFSQTGTITDMDTTQFIQLYDYEDDEFISLSGFHGQRLAAHVFGTVLSIDGSVVKLRMPDNSVRIVHLGGYKLAEVKKSRQTGKITAENAGVDAILAEDTHPGEGSKLVLHNRGRGIGGFIFND